MILVYLTLLSLVACGESSQDSEQTNPDHTGGAIGELSDTTEAGLKSFLEGQTYADWVKSDQHAAVGNSPHGLVQVYFNPTLSQSMQGDATSHPKGSVVLKHMLDDAGGVRGYALNAKLEESSEADSWLFYEVFLASDTSYYGVGLSICSGCHGQGRDFVLESYPS